MSKFEHGNEHSTRHMNILYRRLLSVRDRRHTSAQQARQDGQEYRHDARRGWIRSTGPARHVTGRSSAPLRSHRTHTSIAHRPYEISRAHQPPSAAASTRARCPAESGISFFAISSRASCTSLPILRSPSTGCARAARWCIGEPGRSGRTQRTGGRERSRKPTIPRGSRSTARGWDVCCLT